MMLLVGFLHYTNKLQVRRIFIHTIAGVGILWSFSLNIFSFGCEDTVRKEAATIMAVFPSPNDVMSILVQVFWHVVVLLCNVFYVYIRLWHNMIILVS